MSFILWYFDAISDFSAQKFQNLSSHHSKFQIKIRSLYNPGFSKTFFAPIIRSTSGALIGLFNKFILMSENIRQALLLRSLRTIRVPRNRKMWQFWFKKLKIGHLWQINRFSYIKPTFKHLLLPYLLVKMTSQSIHSVYTILQRNLVQTF